MALSNLAGWNEDQTASACGTSFGAGDKNGSACGAETRILRFCLRCRRQVSHPNQNAVSGRTLLSETMPSISGNRL